MHILVTGATGLVGRQLMQDGRNRDHTMDGTCFQVSAPHLHQLDIRDATAVAETMAEIDPDMVIHTAALTDVDRCEAEPVRAWETNVEAVRTLARCCAEQDAGIVHLSSNYVYPGAGERYAESGCTGPKNLYGKTKLASEYVLDMFDIPTITIRTTVLYGNTGDDFTTWILAELEDGGPVEVVDDQYSHPTYVPDLSAAIYTLIEEERTGLYNVAGPICCSRYEFARQVATTFGYQADAITPGRTDTLDQVAPRPKENCITMNRLPPAIKETMCPPEQALKHMKDEKEGR